MKVWRYKKLHRRLMFFVTHFAYREPYQVLIDATFCQAALQHKVIVEEQIKKHFASQAKLLTTQCIILEAESLGPPLTGATMIVKQFHVHRCGHEGKPISGAECIKSMTKESRYIVASQDRALQQSLRKVPGRCIMYLHKATPVLEAASPASRKYVLKKSQNLLPAEMEKKIVDLKQKQGLQTAPGAEEVKKQRKGPKNPNPLSCKKSKKQKISKEAISDQSETAMKQKRKRLKLPSHVKEVLKTSGS